MFQLAWVVVERNLEGNVDFVRRSDAKRMEEKPGRGRVLCPKVAALDSVNPEPLIAAVAPSGDVVRLLMSSR